MEPEASARTAVCAAHQGAQSTGTCARCGNFVCPLCLDEYSGLPEHCEACREREGGGRIAFEREEGGPLSRWWRTTKDVVLQPTRTFETTRPGPAGSALKYVGLTGVLIGGTVAVCGGGALAVIALAGELPATLDDASGDPALFYGALACAMTFYVALIPASLVLSAALRSAIFHGAARLLGGQAPYGTALWAMGYLHGISITMLPLMVLQQIPVIGPMIGLTATLAIEVFYALQLTTIARRYYGLADGRATAAGWSVLVVGVALACLCCLSFIGVAVLGAAGR